MELKPEIATDIETLAGVVRDVCSHYDNLPNIKAAADRVEAWLATHQPEHDPNNQ